MITVCPQEASMSIERAMVIRIPAVDFVYLLTHLL